jgi:hypothetical protein
MFLSRTHTGHIACVVVVFLALSVVLMLPGCGGGGHGAASVANNKDSSASVDDTPSGQKEGSGTDEVPNVQDTVTQSDFFASSVSKVVDQDDAVKSGPAQYWHRVTGYGNDGDMTWTYVNGSAVCNKMVWRSGLGSGRYTISVFIPRNHATSQSAKYRIGAASGNSVTAVATVSVNQNAIYDQWVVLGTYTINGEPAVMLGDDTGESYSATKRKVGFDAVKFAAESSNPSPTGADKALQNAHNQLGTQPYPKYYCLAVVRNWYGLPAKYSTATAAAQHFRDLGVLKTGGNALGASQAAMVFYHWYSGGVDIGHVAMRCPHGIIHQDNSTAGGGRIAHNSSGAFSTCPYWGYVTYSDAMSKW